jgi:cysteine-rich repeat protein
MEYPSVLRGWQVRKDRNSCFMRSISCVWLCFFCTVGSIEWAEASDRGRLRSDQNTGVIAPLKQEPDSFKSGGVARVSRTQATAGLNVIENDPPELCAGHGEFSSIWLTDWEAGLGSWTVGTHDVAIDFNTPDWDVVSNLPDSRIGRAAFVADLDSVCPGDDGSGALTLDSPPIVIPGDAPVPRILIDHWFATEFGWDGGNFKIRVNDKAFNLIPASAIEAGPYNSTLHPAIGDEIPDNTNPLADQDAFTGTTGGQPSGSWGQSRINLQGIAEAGDSIDLRFDFGVDYCGGLVGWYVDDVEVYSCSAELPPSDCGNSVMDAGEQCDDGNTFIDDGCSNTCQIDDGWQCTAAYLPGVVPDASFESGTPNVFWDEASANFGKAMAVVPAAHTVPPPVSSSAPRSQVVMSRASPSISSEKARPASPLKSAPTSVISLAYVAVGSMWKSVALSK